MSPEQRAREFVSVGFRGLGVPSLEPYITIIAELIEGAVMDERARCANIALAIDSGRGNEKEIAKAIINPAALTDPGFSKREQTP